MSEYFVGSTGTNNQTNFSSLSTSEVLDDLGLNTGDSPTFSGLFLEGSGSTIFSVDGSNGRLFGVTDEVTGTVFSVNDAAGLPIIEVESTSSYDKITLGEYGSDLLVLSGQSTIEITGSQIASQSWVGQQGFITSETDDQNLNEVLAQGNESSYGISVNQISGSNLTLGNGVTDAFIKLDGDFGGGDLTVQNLGNDQDILFKVNDNGSTTTPLMIQGSTSNVGIGTTNPNHKLDIYSNENVPLRIHRPSNANLDSSGAWGIGFSTRGDAVTSTTDTRAGIFSYYNGNLFLAANSTSIVSDPDAYARLTVAAAGNVGIGTTSPASLLNVVASGNGATALTVEDDARKIKIGRDSIQVTDLSNTNTTLYLNGGGGNVSVPVSSFTVGATGPDSGVKLQVTGHSKFKGTSYHSHFNYAGDNSEDTYIRGGKAGSKVRIQDLGNADVLIASGGGNVGIGTTSPTDILTINETADNNGIRINGYDDESSSYLKIFVDNNGRSRIAQNTDGSSGYLFLEAEDYLQLIAGSFVYTQNEFRIYDAGQLSIGNGADFKIKYDNSTDKLNIHSSTNNGITMDTSGNVGIGTTAPQEKFHIHNSTGNSATIRLSDPDSTSTANATGYVEVYHGENTSRAGYFGLITNSEMALATTTSAGNIRLYTGNNTAALAIDSSQNATFAGDIIVDTPTGNSQTSHTLKLKKTNSGGSVQVGAEITSSPYATNTNGGNLVFKTANTSVSPTTALTLDGAQNATFAGDVVVSGGLTVNGTTTTINSTTVQVDDKNIELGTVASPTDVTADGGGITLKGATDKTINWVNSTDAWTFSERVSIPAGSAASPSLTFGTDTDTGIFNRTAGELNFTIGGSWIANIQSTGLKIYAGTGIFNRHGSAAAPSYTFTDDADTGIFRELSGASELISFSTEGTKRAHISSAGIFSQGNVYSGNSGQFRNYGGTWQATTGLTGNGFEFSNSVDGTALTISSTGDTVASGSVTATSLDINGAADISGSLTLSGGSLIGDSNWDIFAEYTNRGRINLLSANATDTTTQIALMTNGNNRLTIDKAGTSTFAGDVIAPNLTLTNLSTYSGSEFTALMIDGSNIVGKRALGSNAFNSTAYLPLAGGTLTGDLKISATDPTITLIDSSGANTDPNGTIIFSEVSGTNNFDINYNGASDRLEFRGLISSTLTDLVYIKRSSTDTVEVFGNVTASSFIKSGGTSSQFLKADGSVDSSTYVSSSALSSYLPLAGGTMTGHILLNNGIELRSKDTSSNIKTIARVNSSNQLEYGWSGGGPVKFMGGGSYTERMRIHSDGNIGIGTTSPASLLHISSSTSGDAVLTIEADTDNNDENDNPYIHFKQDGGGVTAKAGIEGTNGLTFTNSLGNHAYLGSEQNHGVQLYANGAAGLTLRGGGDIGIGTNAPETKLHVYKSSATSGTSTGTSVLRLQNYVGSDLSQQKVFADFVLADDNANEIPQVRIGAEVGQNGDADSQVKEGSGAFVVYTNNADTVSGDAGASLAERMRVDYQGNVGIGTTSPDQKLTIEGNSAAVKVSESGGAELRMAAGGSVGYIGTYNDNDLAILSNTGEKMRVTTGGNVGIGDTTPSYKLDVAGDIRATGDLRADDDVFIAGDVLRFTNDAASAYIQSADALILEADYDADDTGGKPITFKTAGTTKMTIAGGGDVTINNGLIVSGDLTVNGTTSTINSTTLQVDDKNIELGTVATPTDTTADGGGITLKGATDKTINWINSTSSWTSNQTFSAPNLTLTNLSSYSGSEFTALMIDGSNIVGKRALGTNAFNSTAYLPLAGGTMSGDLILDDGSGNSPTLRFQDGSDIKFNLYSDGNSLSITRDGNGGADFILSAHATDYTNSSFTIGGATVSPTTIGQWNTAYTYSQVGHLPLAGGTITGNVRFNDTIKAEFGSGADLQINHDGTQSLIDNGTGNLTIQNQTNDGDIIFKSDDGSGGLAEYFRLDGGAAITVFSKEARFTDNVKLKLGSGPDFEMFHNGSHSYVVNNTGDLEIINNTDDGDIKFVSDDGSGGTATYVSIDGGAVQTRFHKNTRHSDGVIALFGSGNDLQIFHDGSNSYIQDASGTGSLITNTDAFLLKSANNGEFMMTAYQDGAVNLFHNNTTILSTTSQGIKITTPSSTSIGNGIVIDRPSAGTHYHALEFSTAGTCDWSIGQNSADALEIYENGSDSTTRLTILEGGNVGIGTTSPTSPLTIKSNSVSSNDSALTIQGNSNTNAIVKIAEKATDGARFHMYDGGVEKIAFYTDGTANHISAGDVTIANNATISGDLTVSTDFEAASTVTFSSLTNAGSDVDKFLVSNSGDVQFRTGAEVLSDIGGITDVGGKITKKISGDGSATTFTVTHSFGTPHVMTQLLHYGDNGTGATYEVVNATVKRNSDNAIDVVFGVAPTTTEDYLVLITKMPAIS